MIDLSKASQLCCVEKNDLVDAKGDREAVMKLSVMVGRMTVVKVVRMNIVEDSCVSELVVIWLVIVGEYQRTDSHSGSIEEESRAY
jgi:hypothetical protein